MTGMILYGLSFIGAMWVWKVPTQSALRIIVGAILMGAAFAGLNMGR